MRGAYRCEVAIGLDPVSLDALAKSKHSHVRHTTGCAGWADLVLACSESGSDGRIVPKVSLDVGGNDMTVDAVAWDEPLSRDFLRHGCRSVWELWGALLVPRGLVCPIRGMMEITDGGGLGSTMRHSWMSPGVV